MAAPRGAAAEPLLGHPRFRKACSSVAFSGEALWSLSLLALPLFERLDLCLCVLLQSLCWYSAMSRVNSAMSFLQSESLSDELTSAHCGASCKYSRMYSVFVPCKLRFGYALVATPLSILLIVDAGTRRDSLSAAQVADLARGTFGFVQLAEDLTTGEHLAIKVWFWLTLASKKIRCSFHFLVHAYAAD